MEHPANDQCRLIERLDELQLPIEWHHRRVHVVAVGGARRLEDLDVSLGQERRRPQLDCVEWTLRELLDEAVQQRQEGAPTTDQVGWDRRELKEQGARLGAKSLDHRTDDFIRRPCGVEEVGVWAGVRRSPRAPTAT